MTERKVVTTHIPKPADIIEKQFTTAHLPINQPATPPPSTQSSVPSGSPQKK